MCRGCLVVDVGSAPGDSMIASGRLPRHWEAEWLGF